MDRAMRVTVIGGGTGTRTVLEALRDEPRFDLSAVVSMADNGGSTGKLREELDVLPPGDLRQCLLALSTLPKELQAIFEHRFNRGPVNGHPIGNLLLAAAQQHCDGDIEQALCLAKAILQVRGDVVPVTTQRTHLCIKHGEHIAVGEFEISNTPLGEPRVCSLTNDPYASASARQAIEQADAIVIGPGNLYASLIPNFLVRGIPEAIQASSGRLIYIANLVTTPGHTDNWRLLDYVLTIEKYVGRTMSLVIANEQEVPDMLINCAKSGTATVRVDGELILAKRLICAPLVDQEPLQHSASDPIVRNRIRHDPIKLGVLLKRQLLARSV